MKKSLLQVQYSRLFALYQKFQKRLNKHFALGRFMQFSTHKQHTLLNRIERLKVQLNRLERGAKLTGVTLMFTAGIYSQEADAQTGSEFKVNTYTTGQQWYPVIAADSAGDFVVTWRGSGQAGSGYGIYAQRYDNAGVAQGSEFQVNSLLAVTTVSPSIAMDKEGDFVITWARVDGSNYGIYAQRYNNTGVAQGTEFQVNTYTINSQTNPSVAMDSAGDFVITWQSYGQDGSYNSVYAQHYNSAGVAQGGEFLVNTYTTNDQAYPSVAMDSVGDFIITWQSSQDGSFYGVYAQRYNSSGVAQGSEFQVNTYTTNNQGYPAITTNNTGDFIIAWQSNDQDDGGSDGVYAQRYNSAGAVQGSEFLVNGRTSSNQALPSIAMDNTGSFVITWQSNNQDGNNNGVYAKRYDNNGVAETTDFQVNTYTTSDQEAPAIAVDNAGNFVITWQSDGQDGSNHGVYARRYIVHTVTTGVFSSINTTTLTLYPNPAKTEVSINLEGTTTVEVLDLSGHLLREMTTDNGTFSISGMSPGTYLVELSQNDQKVQRKLVIE